MEVAVNLLSKQRQELPMELDELSGCIAEQAQELQRQIEELHFSMHADTVYAQTDPVGLALDRIERRLVRVNGDTSTLLERVPENLQTLLAQIKDMILERIASANRASPRSMGACPSQGSTTGRAGLKEAIEALSPSEQRVFRACFDGGLLTYRQIAERLRISPTRAKNIVNMLFRDDGKRRLFYKRQMHGIAQVALNEQVQKRILSGGAGTLRKNGHLTGQRAVLYERA